MSAPQHPGAWHMTAFPVGAASLANRLNSPSPLPAGWGSTGSSRKEVTQG